MSKQQINNTIPPRISLSCENEQRPTKDYLQLWKWAYREACKQAGITVGKINKKFFLFYLKFLNINYNG